MTDTTEMFMPRTTQAAEDLAEATADTLLTTCALLLTLRTPTEQPELEDAYDLALMVLDRVVERTIREGAKPR